MKTAFFWILLMATNYASSGNIELQIRVSTQLAEDQANLSLEISNTGSTQILDIQPKLLLPANSIEFPSIPKLVPGQRHQLHNQFAIPHDLVGDNFFVPIDVSYRDRVNISNTTVALASFRSDIEVPKLFSLSLSSITISEGCSNAVVHIQRLNAGNDRLGIRLIAPPGILVKPEQYPLTLPDTGKKKIIFELCNKHRLTDSQLPFYAVITSPYGDYSVEESVNATISIKFKSLPERILGNRSLVMWLAAGALAVLLLSGIFSLWRRS